MQTERHLLRAVRAPTAIRIRITAVIGALMLGALLTACGNASPADRLSFAYVGSAPSGFIDQTLTITNKGRIPIAPTLKIVALDAGGHELPELTVHTAFGSDRGELVVIAGSNVEILQFEGPDRGRVADVRVTVVGAREVSLPADVVQPTVTALANGEPTVPSSSFDQVLISNSGAAKLPVRVVYVVWEPIIEGMSQQAASVSTVVDSAKVEGNADLLEQVVPSEAAARIDEVARTGGSASLKVFILAE